jgi:hypothetical protein
MLPLIRYRHALLAVLVLLAVAGPVRAQADPPDRVARLNYISGQVSLRPAALEDWGVATINYPLTTGDHLWTEQNATAELHVASAVIRLAPETAFSFLNLDNDIVQVRVAEGTMDLRVREIFEGETYEIDTPNAAVSILRPGVYHIDVDPGGERTRVTVREGEAEVDASGRVFSVYAGQMAEIIGIEDVAYDLGRALSPDRWELWCRDRDRREDNRLALNYVPRDMVGYEDLDDYGTWSYVPEYGYGWEPTVVAVDWAPYRYGHWSWLRPWGWTWIDDARWGFAPFHYGRWTCYRSRWIWLPGRRQSRPVWAPALVAFVGTRNWNFSFAFGVRPAIGWFPLGPGDFYCPSYRASPRYWRNVNVTNVNVTNVNVNTLNVARLRYSNRDVAGAMTAVPRDVFVAAQSVHRVGTAVPRAIAEQTPVLGHGASATPAATSVLGRVPASAARPPASVMQRAVVARADPPAAATLAAPVVSLSRRPRPDVSRPVEAVADVNGVRVENAEAPPSAGPTRNGTAARPGSEERNAGAATADNRQPANRDNDTYIWPRNDQLPRGSASDRPASAAARPRNEPSTPDSVWRASDGRTAEATQPVQSPRNTESQQAAGPRSQAPTYQAPTYNAPKYDAPSYQAPRYQYEAPRAQATPREDRPAQNSDRAVPREERSTPAREVREAPAPAQSARPRAKERSQDRPASPARVAAPAAAPAPASRPPERAAERPQPQSGTQSSQSARPRGGRGGQ